MGEPELEKVLSCLGALRICLIGIVVVTVAGALLQLFAFLLANQ